MKLNYSTTNNAAAGRIEEIDVARGIAIISVIIGHLVWAEGFLYRFIYSFHMPIFSCFLDIAANFTGRKLNSFHT